MIEKLLQNLLNSAFPVLYSLGLVVAEPGLFQGLLLGDSKRVLVLMLHDLDNIGNLTKPEVQQLL